MLRFTRKWATGIQKIEDRKPGKKEGEYEKHFHVFGAASPQNPKPVMEEYELKGFKMEDGQKVEVIQKKMRAKKDDRGRLVVQPGEGFEVHDEDFVLSKHGAILEKC